MTTIRVKHQSRYTVIANETLRDRRLSYKARGLHHELLSYPDDWVINIKQLTTDKDRRTAIMSAMAELEEFGYLVKEKSREAGRFSCDYVIREVSSVPDQVGKSDTVEQPPEQVFRRGKTDAEKPTRKNRRGKPDDILSNVYPSTVEQSTVQPNTLQPSQVRACDFEPSIPEPESTVESVPVAPPIAPTARREIVFTPDPMSDRFSAGGGLPEWRTGRGVNGLKPEFVEWLCKSYLAKLPCNKDQAAPSMADARHWIMSREKYQTELVENQWLAFQDRGAQTVAKTSAAYDWSRDSRLSEWTALANSMNNYRFCYPDGVRDEERVAFYQWLEKQEVRSA